MKFISKNIDAILGAGILACSVAAFIVVLLLILLNF